MITYQYRAVGADGKPARGVVEATDEYSAVQKIRANYQVITEISEVKQKNGILSMEIGGKAKVNGKSLSIMCSQFAIMLKSGIPLGRCIDMITEQTEDKKLKKVLKGAAEDVMEGNGVAASLERNGKDVFPDTFIETIRAGEESGTIETSFEKMKVYYETSFRNSEKIKKAMSYPIFVLVVAVVVIIVVMAFVIPTLSRTFTEMGGELPLMTQILINVSNFFSKWWWLFLLIILVLVVGILSYSKTQKGALFIGKLQLKMPVIGKISTMNGAAEFADTMSVMMSCGLTVNRALDVTSKVLSNEVLRQSVAMIKPKIEEGRSLGETLKHCEFFPENLKQMTAIGEETGALDNTLNTIGEYYTNEASYLTDQAISMLEPTMLIFLAVFAGFIVISIYLPMFTMYNLF